jgi:predicted MFS family arabinose efflux permease
LIYGFAIITFILVAIFIPEPEKQVRKSDEKHKMNKQMTFICIAILIYAVIYFSFFGFISYVVAKFGGNAAQSGLASMVMTLCSLIMGILFSGVLKLLKRATLPIILILNVVGYYVLSQSTGFGMIVVGAAVVGLGFGLLMPYGTMRIMEAAPKSAASFANGMYMTFINIGTAISPAILAVIGTTFDHKDDGQFIWFVSAILLAVGALISIVMAFTSKGTNTVNE